MKTKIYLLFLFATCEKKLIKFISYFVYNYYAQYITFSISGVFYTISQKITQQKCWVTLQLSSHQHCSHQAIHFFYYFFRIKYWKGCNFIDFLSLSRRPLYILVTLIFFQLSGTLLRVCTLLRTLTRTRNLPLLSLRSNARILSSGKYSTSPLRNAEFFLYIEISFL